MSNDTTALPLESRDLEQSERSGGIARSLGSAVGFMRRLVPGKTKKQRTRPSVEDGVERAAAKPRRPVATPTDFDRMERDLRLEIDVLETELQRLHATITSGALSQDKEGSAPTLEGLIRQSRQIRERIHEKRQDLARVERHIARERRLRPPAPKVAMEAPTAKPRKKKEPRSLFRAARSQQRYEDATGRRAAMEKAIREASFAGRSERLAFEREAEGLTNEDPDVRRETVARIGKQRTALALELMLVASGDPNARVRRAAVNALLGFGDRRAIRVYRQFLNDADAPLRLAALRGLGGFDAELSGTELIDALDDADATIRKTAAAMLGTRPTRGALTSLLLAVRDDDDGVRMAAAESLGMLGEHRAVLSLIRAIADESENVRVAARHSLATILNEDVYETVAGAAKDDEERAAKLKAWWTSARVVKALDRLGGLGPLSPPKDLPEAAAKVKAAAGAEAEDWEKFESVLPEEAEKAEAEEAEAEAEEAKEAEEEAEETEEKAKEEAAEGEKEGEEEGEYEDIF
jgi:HEAT repeat protein